MSAREIIASADVEFLHGVPVHPTLRGADAIIEALAAAGYRIIAPDDDDEATTVYGRLLWLHMDALRKSDEPRRERLFALIEAFRAEFPAECKVWDDRYDERARSLKKKGGGG